MILINLTHALLYAAPIAAVGLWVIRLSRSWMTPDWYELRVMKLIRADAERRAA